MDRRKSPRSTQPVLFVSPFTTVSDWLVFRVYIFCKEITLCWAASTMSTQLIASEPAWPTSVAFTVNHELDLLTSPANSRDSLLIWKQLVVTIQHRLQRWRQTTRTGRRQLLMMLLLFNFPMIFPSFCWKIRRRSAISPYWPMFTPIQYWNYLSKCLSWSAPCEHLPNSHPGGGSVVHYSSYSWSSYRGYPTSILFKRRNKEDLLVCEGWDTAIERNETCYTQRPYHLSSQPVFSCCRVATRWKTTRNVGSLMLRITRDYCQYYCVRVMKWVFLKCWILLQSMVANQKNIAEKRKEEVEKMSTEVQKQQVEINSRKEEAQRDLDEAEPALRSAQASVRGIKKRDLDEVRALARPPDNVKLTLECVSIMPFVFRLLLIRLAMQFSSWCKSMRRIKSKRQVSLTRHLSRHLPVRFVLVQHYWSKMSSILIQF